LTRRRIQTGSVRLREDGTPPYWEGFYREDVVTEAGKKVRKRRAVNLGSVKEVRSEKAALQKLAVILEPINQVKCRPKKNDDLSRIYRKVSNAEAGEQEGNYEARI